MGETVSDRGPCTECGTPHAACVGPDYCCDECLHLDANWDGYERPEPARPVGGDTREAELREEVAEAVATAGDGYWARADAVLALPAVRAALAAQETDAETLTREEVTREVAATLRAFADYAPGRRRWVRRALLRSRANAMEADQ